MRHKDEDVSFHHPSHWNPHKEPRKEPCSSQYQGWWPLVTLEHDSQVSKASRVLSTGELQVVEASELEHTS